MATAFDQVILLDRGGMAAYGTPEEVLNSRGLTKVYEHPIEVVQHPLRPGILVLPFTEDLNRLVTSINSLTTPAGSGGGAGGEGDREKDPDSAESTKE